MYKALIFFCLSDHSNRNKAAGGRSDSLKPAFSTTTIENAENDRHNKVPPISIEKPALPLNSLAVNENASSIAPKGLQKSSPIKQDVEQKQLAHNDHVGRIGFLRKNITNRSDIYSPLQLHDATVAGEHTLNRSKNLTNLEDVSEHLIDITLDELEPVNQTNLSLFELESKVGLQDKFLEEIHRKSLPTSIHENKSVAIPTTDKLIQNPNSDIDKLNETKVLYKSSYHPTNSPNRSAKKYLEFTSKTNSPLKADNNITTTPVIAKLPEPSQTPTVDKNECNSTVPKWLQETDVKNYPYNFITALQKKLYNIVRQKEQNKITMHRQFSHQPAVNVLPQHESPEQKYDSSSFTSVISSTTSHKVDSYELVRKTTKRTTSSSAKDLVSDYSDGAKDKWEGECSLGE